MLKTITLATLALSLGSVSTLNTTEQDYIIPEIVFTTDSVFTNESILNIEDAYKDESTGNITLTFSENHYLGYCIYDNPDTEYIDGFKFDDSFVTNWKVSDVDFTVTHTLYLKTVYTEDIAGMLAAAKNGDWSKILSNPLMVFQLVYYILATLTLLIGGLGLAKSKKYKSKTSEEIAKEVETKAAQAATVLEEKAIDIVNTIVTPIIAEVKDNLTTMVEAYTLSQSNDPNARIALINLLKSKASTQTKDVIDDIVNKIKQASTKKEQIKQEADKVIAELSKIVKDNDSEGGITI